MVAPSLGRPSGCWGWLGPWRRRRPSASPAARFDHQECCQSHNSCGPSGTVYEHWISHVFRQHGSRSLTV